LRRLSHIHHFARFIHEDTTPGRIKDNAPKPDHRCTPLGAVELWGTPRESVMTPRHTERQGILGRSCSKNRGLFQAINGYSGVVIPVLEYPSRRTTITCAFACSLAVRSDGIPLYSFLATRSHFLVGPGPLKPQRFPDGVNLRSRQLVHANLARPRPRKSLRRPLARRVNSHL